MICLYATFDSGLQLANDIERYLFLQMRHSLVKQ